MVVLLSFAILAFLLLALLVFLATALRRITGQVIGQLAGLTLQVSLPLGKLARIGATVRFALNALLLGNDLVNPFQVFADPFLFRFQMLAAVLAQEQVEQST